MSASSEIGAGAWTLRWSAYDQFGEALLVHLAGGGDGHPERAGLFRFGRDELGEGSTILTTEDVGPSSVLGVGALILVGGPHEHLSSAVSVDVAGTCHGIAEEAGLLFIGRRELVDQATVLTAEDIGASGLCRAVAR